MTVGAVISGLVAISIVAGYLAGVQVDGEKPRLAQVLAPTLLMGVMAWLYGVSFAESCRNRDGDRIHNPQITWRYRKQSGSCARG